MKNKIFNVWIKELCSLVFVQSMQAFLFSIMLIVVLRLYVNSGDNITAKESMGVYAIFVLMIIPKVELLVKKIFGLGSGVMDDSMMGGKQSLLKTGLAIGGAAHVLNNAGKIVGGVAAIASTSRFGAAGKKARIAKNNMDTAELNQKNSQLSSELPSPDTNISNQNRLKSNISGGFSLGDLSAAIKNANAPDPSKEYEQAKRELLQKRLDGAKQLTSGITETAGALGGAALGAIVGMGTGGDDIITNMGIGAGIGDKVGAAVADVTVGSLGNISDYNYNRKKLNSELQKSESKKINAKNEYEQLVNQINNNKNNKSNNTNSNNSNNNVYKNDIVQENYKKAVAAKRNGNMKEYEFYRTKAAGAAQALKKQQTESEKQAKDAINNAKKTMGRSNNNNRRITKNNNFNIDNNVDNIY